MTKKNLIFSIFEDIRIDKKFEAKQNNTLTQFRKYYDKLIANHKQYAEYCNADYKMRKWIYWVYRKTILY